MVIYKYNVGQFIYTAINKFLAAQYQDGNLVVWAEVDLEAPKKNYYLADIGTGEEIQDDLIYIGTIQTGLIVHHIYAIELKDPRMIESIKELFGELRIRG